MHQNKTKIISSRLYNKIKENCDHSKNVDGETRKKNAEETINELIHYLQLNEDKEDDEDII